MKKRGVMKTFEIISSFLRLTSKTKLKEAAIKNIIFFFEKISDWKKKLKKSCFF